MRYDSRALARTDKRLNNSAPFRYRAREIKHPFVGQS